MRKYINKQANIRSLVMIASVLIFNALWAQENRTEVCIDFKVGSYALDFDNGDNDKCRKEIMALSNRLKSDSTLTISHATFYGYASPEGSYQLNKKLAYDRLINFENYFRSFINVPDSVITRNDEYIPWSLLKKEVETSNLSNKQEIIQIIDEPADLVKYGINREIDKRVIRLKQLNNGRTWWELNRSFFAKMRNACAAVITVDVPTVVNEEIIEEISEVVEPIVEPEPAIERSSIATDTRKPFYMSVRTNLLFDAMVIPNIGVDFYLGNNWSIGANWMYSWWKNSHKNRFWRTYGGDLNIRKWFGKKANEKPLSGHHAGVYGQMLTYDFELGNKGYLGDKWSYGAGIEYGYSLPMSRRLNMDFTIGVGYLGGKYKKYIPVDGHYVWQSTHQRHWFGPTKAEISLVWLLGRGNVNDKKGGMR